MHFSRIIRIPPPSSSIWKVIWRISFPWLQEGKWIFPGITTAVQGGFPTAVIMGWNPLDTEGTVI